MRHVFVMLALVLSSIGCEEVIAKPDSRSMESETASTACSMYVEIVNEARFGLVDPGNAEVSRAFDRIGGQPSIEQRMTSLHQLARRVPLLEVPTGVLATGMDLNLSSSLFQYDRFVAAERQMTRLCSYYGHESIEQSSEVLADYVCWRLDFTATDIHPIGRIASSNKCR